MLLRRRTLPFPVAIVHGPIIFVLIAVLDIKTPESRSFGKEEQGIGPVLWSFLVEMLFLLQATHQNWLRLCLLSIWLFLGHSQIIYDSPPIGVSVSLSGDLASIFFVFFCFYQLTRPVLPWLARYFVGAGDKNTHFLDEPQRGPSRPEGAGAGGGGGPASGGYGSGTNGTEQSFKQFG